MAQSIPRMGAHRSLVLDTARGPGRVYIVDAVEVSSAPAGTLVLGHGAGKGTNTPDLVGLTALARDGWRVVLVDQPWVVAGRRVATAPRTLDEAWTSIVDSLRREGEIVGRFVQGGRSAGARVACRTAQLCRADAVVALAFPLVPPGKAGVPARWRTHEAEAVVRDGIPLLVVQGASDAFGGPQVVREQVPGAEVVGVKGPHGFSRYPSDVVDAVRAWLVHGGQQR